MTAEGDRETLVLALVSTVIGNVSTSHPSVFVLCESNRHDGVERHVAAFLSFSQAYERLSKDYSTYVPVPRKEYTFEGVGCQRLVVWEEPGTHSQAEIVSVLLEAPISD